MAPGAEPLTVGAQLAEARRMRQLTIGQVSEQTKIQPWILDSLETDRLHQLMSRIYVKGFLTTYAEFLGLDAAALLAALPLPASEAQDVGEEPAPLSPPVAVPSWSVSGAWLRRAGVVLAAAAVGALVMVNPLRWLPKISLTGWRDAQLASVSLMSDPTKPPDPAPSLEAGVPLEVVVKARRATWIRVRADGRLVAQQWLQRGAEEQWSAKRELELIVARPSEVELTLNGQPISPLAMAHGGRLMITHGGISALGGDDEP